MAKKADNEVRVIKKYQNRKLYDTQDSRYITLDDISGMVRENTEVKVIDNKSKNDVTSVIFAQILVEQEKASRSNLPPTLLRDLIRKGKGSISDFMHRYVVLNTGSEKDRKAEAQKYVDQLVTEGALNKTEARVLLKEVINEDPIQKEFDSQIGKQISSTVKNLTNLDNIETHITSLNQKINQLETKLSQYE